MLVFPNVLVIITLKAIEKNFGHTTCNFFNDPKRIVRISSQLEVDGPGVLSYPVKKKICKQAY